MISAMIAAISCGSFLVQAASDVDADADVDDDVVEVDVFCSGGGDDDDDDDDDGDGFSSFMASSSASSSSINGGDNTVDDDGDGDEHPSKSPSLVINNVETMPSVQILSNNGGILADRIMVLCVVCCVLLKGGAIVRISINHLVCYCCCYCCYCCYCYCCYICIDILVAVWCFEWYLLFVRCIMAPLNTPHRPFPF
jgi:hypothetical protein